MDANRKGEPIKSLCDALDRAILYLLLVEQQEGNVIQVTNDINNELHIAMSHFRRHGAKWKGLQAADKAKHLKKESLRRQPVSVHGQTMKSLLDRSNIEFFTQKGLVRGGHKPKQRDIQKFLTEGNKGVYDKILEPLWSLRHLMWHLMNVILNTKMTIS